MVESRYNKNYTNYKNYKNENIKTKSVHLNVSIIAQLQFVKEFR